MFYHHKDGLICRIEREDRLTLSDWLRRLWGKQTAKTSTLEKGAEERCGPPDQYHSWRISLTELQRMQLRKLQCRLVRAVVDMRLHNHELCTWAQYLKSFGTIHPFFLPFTPSC